MKKRKTARRATTTRRKATTRRNPSKKRRRSPRRNPIIGDTALELTYEGGDGKRKGKMKGPWTHPFETDDVEIHGLKDGSIVLKSRSGKRLWDFFEVER